MAQGCKPWKLTKTETLSSFENWKCVIINSLRHHEVNRHYLASATRWSRKRTSRTRGFVQIVNGKSATAQTEDLEQMLGMIATYCPVINRNVIIDDSRNIEEVWKTIRQHYNFQQSAANFLDLADFVLEPDERPEDLYQRMTSFIRENLLERDDPIVHDDERRLDHEYSTPMVENMTVLMWLQKIHPKLPALVKQKYATELKSKTLFYLKPEISMAINSLLEELQSTSANLNRLSSNNNYSRNNSRGGRSSYPSQYSRQNSSQQSRNTTNPRRSTPKCPLCQQANRPDNHLLSKCSYLPEADRRYMSVHRQIKSLLTEIDPEDEVEEDAPENFSNPDHVDQSQSPLPSTSLRRVMIKSSPFFNAYHESKPVTITLDCGAESDFIRLDTANKLGLKINKSIHNANLADMKTPLNVIGETQANFSRGNRCFVFNGLVVDQLDSEILAGVPFMTRNDIIPRCAKNEIIIGDSGEIIRYGSSTKSTDSSSVRRTSVVRAANTTTIWPGDFIELQLSKEHPIPDLDVAIDPRIEDSHKWVEPSLLRSVNNTIRLENNTNVPQIVKKHDHVCQFSEVFSPPASVGPDETLVSPPPNKLTASVEHASLVSVDPDGILPTETKNEFINLHPREAEVFNPNIGLYNHAFGHYEASVNMGSAKPPQRKGRLPLYSRNQLTTLQEHFDEHEKLGVLIKPSTVSTNIEYLSPSFLVKKPNGNGHRLVTAFAEIGQYCKPQPSILPSVDSTLRVIGNWRYLIVSDLKSAYFQIPLNKDSMKYCGTASPFKGTRVYTRCAMGMPGSETALEEVLNRVLGDLVTKGFVTKLADDLYIGGSTPDNLLRNWSSVLQALKQANLTLSANKTIIAPKETTILGWVWSQGTIRASPHKIASLAMCTKPVTVKNMRSFLGAYKMLSRVIPGCSYYLQSLNKSTSGKSSSEKIEWSDTLKTSFEQAQKHLQSNQSVVLPNESDHLWIITDGAASPPGGIGATLYAIRNGKPRVAGFFSQKLNLNQATWFPCEVEGLAIAAAVNFFSAFIIQSKNTTRVLTDSKPCHEAYKKLCKGEFSANSRLASFLNSASRHHVTIDHIAGTANLLSDFASRNPTTCTMEKCQVCQFTKSIDASVVRAISISDIKNGSANLPYTNRKAWLVTQAECPDLRRVKAQLLQGTQTNNKRKGSIKNIKRYLNSVSIAKDGLLVVNKTDPLALTREKIVVPEGIINGLITAIHVKLDHPSANELFSIMDRHFFAMNLREAVESTLTNCHLCQSLKKIPKSLLPQSTSDPPESISSQFAVDVLKRERQLILVGREYITSYTFGNLIPSERAADLKNGLLKALANHLPLYTTATVRVDPAPGFKSLVNDELLKRHNIQDIIGRSKNVNKNPVAERAIQEVEEQITKSEQHNTPINDTNLSLLIAKLNSKLRSNGLSSREMMTQRNQFTNTQIHINDFDIIMNKHKKAINNHSSSARSKAPGRAPRKVSDFSVGDLVYVYSDRDKHHSRQRYLLTGSENHMFQIRKLANTQFRSESTLVNAHEIYHACKVTKPNNNFTTDSDDDDTEPINSNPVANVPTDSDNDSDSIYDTEPSPVPIDAAQIPAPPVLASPNDNSTDITGDSQASNSRPQRTKNVPAWMADYTT